jgi:hypothetical protein
LFQLRLTTLPQPDDTTCGPTCLHAVYNYFDAGLSLDDVIREVEPLPGGGTLAVTLANHALGHGFEADIYTYNLQVFDPTWFAPGISLADKLRAQEKEKQDPKLSLATTAYLRFLEAGGRLHYEHLSVQLIRKFLKRGVPLLTGLSATFLYRSARERYDRYDDIRGEPTGHFVVLSGYDPVTRQVNVADPLNDNPRYGSHYYKVGLERLVSAILLGIITYDANLLLISPRRKAKGH